MELLKEKRQAVISHAVTKGLNPDAPMKPSGIEWLGDVPAHWESTAIKALSRLIKRGVDLTQSQTEFDGGKYSSLNVGGAYSVTDEFENMAFTETRYRSLAGMDYSRRRLYYSERWSPGATAAKRTDVV